MLDDIDGDGEVIGYYVILRESRINNYDNTKTKTFDKKSDARQRAYWYANKLGVNVEWMTG